MTKDRAIEVLDEYLYYKYNLDPLEPIKVKAHRLYIDDHGTFFQMVMSALENYQSELKFSEWVGGGSFYIDKSTECIYAIGSSPWIDWEQEFRNYKKGKSASVDWKPQRNEYLDCGMCDEQQLDYEYEVLPCSIESRSTVIKNYLVENQANYKHYNAALRRLAIVGQSGEVLVSSNVTRIGKSTLCISLNFVGGVNEYPWALNTIKKWCRVNGKLATGKYFAEVQKIDEKIDFDLWPLQMKMYI